MMPIRPFWCIGIKVLLVGIGVGRAIIQPPGKLLKALGNNLLDQFIFHEISVTSTD